MRRRDFIAGLGAAAWPLASQAQQIPLPEIGFLSTQSPTLVPESFPAFSLGLAETGFSKCATLGKRLPYSPSPAISGAPDNLSPGGCDCRATTG